MSKQDYTNLFHQGIFTKLAIKNLSSFDVLLVICKNATMMWTKQILNQIHMGQEV